MFHIKIPATTTNFGSGFDALGMALTIYNEIIIEKSDKFEIILSENDAGKIPTDKDNLIFETIQQSYIKAGEIMPALKIQQINNIPISKGLGSSAACIVGGILAANCFLENKLDTNQMYQLAVKLDGHGDNVIPAFVGGFVNVAADKGKIFYSKDLPTEKYTWHFVIPDYEIATKTSRGVLPKSYSKEDAVSAIANALLIKSSIIKGESENIRRSLDDRIHQPYRKEYIRNFDMIMDIAYENNACGAYLSGSGSAIAVIAEADFDVEKFRKDLPSEYEVLSAKCDVRGAWVQETK